MISLFNAFLFHVAEWLCAREERKGEWEKMG